MATKKSVKVKKPVKKAPGKKPAVKKPAVKKSVAKPAKKATAKKPAAKKKSVAKKPIKKAVAKTGATTVPVVLNTGSVVMVAVDDPSITPDKMSFDAEGRVVVKDANSKIVGAQG